MSGKLGINDLTLFTEIPDSELQNISGGNPFKKLKNYIEEKAPGLVPCAVGAIAGPAVGVDPVTGCIIADKVAKN